jgi:glycosyltransferase involved in cell wall biosynthesis
MTNKNILILVPAVTARGGITNYYQVLKTAFSDRVEYFERGARTWPYRKGVLSELLRAWKDYLAFRKRVAKNDIKLVQTTTSLGFNTIIRDGLFIRHARKKGLKTIVFFRGWDETAVKKVEKRYHWLFKFFFFKADTLITLSEKAKTDLKKWGYHKDIRVETTLVDKKLLEGVNEAFIVDKFQQMEKKCNLLFLSRIEKRKGIYELLEAYRKLFHDPKNNFSLTLSICGDGTSLKDVNQWIASEKLSGVELKGFVSGSQKKAAFEDAHVFVFPSYGEGMPNAVLEAMGFGLPVITTPVGGVVDFFVPGKNGYFVSINNIQDMVEKIKTLLQDKDGMCAMALNNYRYAEKIFRSDKVAQRMEIIFDQTMSD